MRIRLIGKTTSTIGHSVLQIKGVSGKKYPFKKSKGEGYIYSTEETKEIEDIFNSQCTHYAYFFTPVVEKSNSKPKTEIDTEDKSLDELRELCESLNIPTIKQDKERSLTRMLEAYKLGSS